MSFKGIKKILYSTPMDVRLLNSIFDYTKEDEVVGDVVQKIKDSLIESHLYDADAFIRSYLSANYSESSFINQTPYYKGPLSLDINKSYIRILGVTIGSAAVTEQWTITLKGLVSSADTFSVEGSFSGAQGSGDMGSDFVSTNGDLSIAAASWDYKNDEASQSGDKIIIMTYYTHPLIRTISSYLAGSSLIDYLYSDAEESQSSWSNTYYKKAMTLLKQLMDPNSGVGLEGTTSASVDHEAVGYHIDSFGRDITKYRDITYDNLPFNNNASGDDF